MPGAFYCLVFTLYAPLSVLLPTPPSPSLRRRAHEWECRTLDGRNDLGRAKGAALIPGTPESPEQATSAPLAAPSSCYGRDNVSLACTSFCLSLLHALNVKP